MTMSEGWQLMVRERPPLPVEVGSLLPERLAGLTRAEVERLPLALGRRTVALADLFSLAGGPGPRLVLAGPCDRLDGVGRGLASGEIIVESDAGHEIGASQSGGKIRIAGSVGDQAALGMRAGVLTVAGNAGAFLGAPPAGERLGMRGGLVTVGGGVGPRAGEHMRRGTILISGDAGGACGARMVAGTIAVAGAFGATPGLRMRRGTLIAARALAGVPDTFAETGRADPTILNLLARRLRAVAPWLEPLLTVLPPRRLAGDLAVDGKGEILLMDT